MVRSWARRVLRGAGARDLALAAVALAGGLVLLAFGGYVRLSTLPWHAPTWAFVLPVTVASGAVALRRAAPRTSLAIGTAALVADQALGGSLSTVLIYTQVLYDAVVYGPPTLWRRSLRVSIAFVALGVVVGIALTGSVRGAALGIPPILVLVLPTVTGISVRQARDQAAAERARAEQTARLVELDRRQAVADERTRMARELHDVVANHLSAVAIHSTAALSVRTLRPEQVTEALRVIRENSVQGLAEMRQLIDVLRGPADRAEGGDPPATPRLAEVDGLAERARAAGLAVDLTTRGVPRPLPVGVDLAAYRIVQESLTNALKHGGGEARVLVDYRAGEVALRVCNPLPGGAPPAVAAPLGAGAGLIGMRERAALVQGRFAAGPDPGGRGWRVEAGLPTGDGAP